MVQNNCYLARMTKTPSQHIDEIELLYSLGKHGWSDLYLIVQRKVHKFRITHIFSDPLDDFIDLCRALIDSQDYWIRLFDEPGATLINVAVDKNQTHLVELSVFEVASWESAPRDTEPVIKVVIKSSQLIGLITHQLEKVQALCEENSYQKDRTEFPRKAFNELLLYRESNSA